MKKLVMAVAIAMVGIAANAATYNWKCTSDWVTAADTDEYSTLSGMAVYVFDGNVISSSSLITALGTSSAKDSFASALGNGVIDGDGAFAITGSGLSDNGATPPYASAYAVILDAADLASATKYYVYDSFDSVKITDAVIAGSAVFSTGDDSIYTGATSTWASIGGSVPEPTSGLLLLLGVAGLALKRKRM